MTQQSEALQLAKDMRAFGYVGIRPEGVRILCEALLATPPAAQRQPLDAGEVSRIWKRHSGLAFARAIEAAHGIGGEQ